MITDFRNSYACGNGESTTLIVEVCIRLGVHYIYKPVGGNCFCVKELSLVYVETCYVYIFRTGYIYIFLFCGDPFFHLRAHPTQMMG